jgi:hypothetical protein
MAQMTKNHTPLDSPDTSAKSEGSFVQNPAFNSSYIREMTKIRVAKSAEDRMTLFT